MHIQRHPTILDNTIDPVLHLVRTLPLTPHGLNTMPIKHRSHKSAVLDVAKFLPWAGPDAVAPGLEEAIFGHDQLVCPVLVSLDPA